MQDTLTWGELNSLAAAVALLRHVVEGGNLPETLVGAGLYAKVLEDLEDKLTKLMLQ